MRLCIALVLLAATLTVASAQVPRPSSLSYQGRLEVDGTPYTGSADIRFMVFDAPVGGTQIGRDDFAQNVQIVDGLFTVPVDLDAGPRDDFVPYLEIAIATPAGSGGAVRLPERIALTAAPYALRTRGLSVLGSNVGIGTDAPTHPLHVVGMHPAMLVESADPVGTWFNLQNASPGGRFWKMVSTGSGNGEGAGNLLIGHGSQAETIVPVMTMRGNGHVGVGTTAPLDRLHLANGAMRFPDGTRQSTAYAPLVRNVSLGTFNVPANGQNELLASVPGAQPGMAVIVTPPYRLWDFHAIGYAFVESPGQVRWRIVSTGSTNRLYGAGVWRVTVLP